MHASSPSAIDIKIGSLDNVSVEIVAKNALKRFDVVSGQSGIEVTERPSKDEAAKIYAWIPGRFCSVDVSTQGAPIQIEGITEASVRAFSYGGDIHMGNVKGVEAIADTKGGNLTGTVTAQDVQINTAGGELHLKRLVGVDVEVLSGPATVGVCYCDNVSLDTAGGDVSIGHMNCNGPSAVVQSHGGRIQVGGMDGVGTLLSQGGPIETQITEKARDVKLLSSGGNISAQLVPALSATLDIEAAGGIDLSPDLGLDAGPANTLQQGCTSLKANKAAERESDASPARSLPRTAEIEIDAGAGAVTLSKQTWMSAISAKLQAAKSASANN